MKKVEETKENKTKKKQKWNNVKSKAQNNAIEYGMWRRGEKQEFFMHTLST